MLKHAVQRQIRTWEKDLERRLWTEHETLIVGVSGGPDSLTLLHLLAKRGLHKPDKLVAAHLNHMLRPSAAEEARWVAHRCESWGIRYRIGTVDVGELARAQGYSLEEAARHARYRFLGELALELQAAGVVVGHTADDQAETVLMHFIRGAGLDGLRGMRPVSPLPDFPQLRLLRPLLNVTRAEVEAYCVEHDLDPIRDPSNVDTSYYRNRLRHELLPLLEEYNPQIRERLLNTAKVVRADVEFLHSQEIAAWESIVIDDEKEWIRLDLARWRQLPLSLRRRTLRHAVWRLRRSLRDAGFRPIEQARVVAEQAQVGARASLPGDLQLEVEYETLLLSTPEVEPEAPFPQLSGGAPAQLNVPGGVALQGGWRLQAEIGRREDFEPLTMSPDPWLQHVDADSAGSSLTVRARRAGERFQPLGMHGHTKKVADVMIDEKVPQRLRAHWPIVANQNHLQWVVGLQLDERVRITESTRRVIQLRCMRVQS